MDMDRHGRRKRLSIYPQLTKPHHVLIDEPSTAFQVNFVLRPLRATDLKKFAASRFYCHYALSFSSTGKGRTWKSPSDYMDSNRIN